MFGYVVLSIKSDKMGDPWKEGLSAIQTIGLDLGLLSCSNDSEMDISRICWIGLVLFKVLKEIG